LCLYPGLMEFNLTHLLTAVKCYFCNAYAKLVRKANKNV
jgi:hypothetical protein